MSNPSTEAAWTSNSAFSNLNLATLMMACVLVAAALVPLAGQAYLTRLVTLFLIYAIVSVSLDLLVGYGGMISFGHAAFFGLGSYTTALLGLEGFRDFLVTLPVSGAIGALGALAVGAFSLKTRGAYFIMITLAFAQMLYYASIAATRFGGDDGVRVPRNMLAGIAMRDPATFLYLVLVILLLVLFFCRRLVASRFGRTLLAIKDNDRRVASSGYNPYLYRLTAFTIAGGLAGVAGGLQANLNEYASPAAFHWILSGDFLVMIILGGVGNLAGAVIGSAIFVVLQNLISAYTPYWMLVMAPLILAVVYFSSNGVIGLVYRTRRVSHV